MFENVQVKLLVAADMGDVTQSLNESKFDCYDPVKKKWSETTPIPNTDAGTTVNENKFSIASCQFAMHYMFQNYERANHFFRQVSSNLRLNGVFISTTVDARVVADMCVKLDSESSSRDFNYKKDLAIHADLIEDIIGDDVVPSSSPLVMNIHFDDNNWKRLLNISNTSENKNVFGVRYVFTLVDDPAKGNAVDAPEWLVPLGEPLHQLAAAHGLEIELCQNFHDFVHEKMGDISLRCVFFCIAALTCRYSSSFLHVLY